MRAVLVGNYGVGNLGDEALKEYFLERFPDLQWSIVSAHPSEPREIPRLPLGIRSLFGTPWWRTVGAIRRADVVIFGGGTLFTDIESLSACVLWGLHAFVAHIFRRPVILGFQGIGPFRTGIGERITRSVVRSSEGIIVRDDQSFDQVKSWNLDTEVVLSFDPILTKIFHQNKEGSRNVLVIIPRKNPTDLFWRSVDNNRRSTLWQAIRIVTLQPGDTEECEVIDRLQALIGRPTDLCVVRSLPELVAAFHGAGHVITQRFHGAIAALALGIPQTIVPQAEGDKLSEITRVLERKSPDRLYEDLRSRVRRGEEAMLSLLSRLSP